MSLPSRRRRRHHPRESVLESVRFPGKDSTGGRGWHDSYSQLHFPPGCCRSPPSPHLPASGVLIHHVKLLGLLLLLGEERDGLGSVVRCFDVAIRDKEGGRRRRVECQRSMLGKKGGERDGGAYSSWPCGSPSSPCGCPPSSSPPFASTTPTWSA